MGCQVFSKVSTITSLIVLSLALALWAYWWSNCVCLQKALGCQLHKHVYHIWNLQCHAFLILPKTPLCCSHCDTPSHDLMLQMCLDCAGRLYAIIQWESSSIPKNRQKGCTWGKFGVYLVYIVTIYGTSRKARFDSIPCFRTQQWRVECSLWWHVHTSWWETTILQVIPACIACVTMLTDS